MTYCAANTATGVDALPDGQIFVASMEPCLGLMDARGEPIWTVTSPILDSRVRLTKCAYPKTAKSLTLAMAIPGLP